MSESLTDAMTPADAAVYLDVSVRTIHRYLHGGLLPFVRKGPRRIYIRRADLDALIRPGNDQ